MKRSIILLFLFSCLFSQAQKQSERYKITRDSLLEEMNSGADLLFYDTTRSIRKYLAEALPQYKNDKKVIAWKLYQTAEYFSLRHIADSAIYYFEKSSKTIGAKGDPNLYITDKIQLIEIYAATGQPEMSLQSIKDAKTAINKNSNLSVLVSLYNAIGNYYTFNSEKDKAIESYLKALSYAERQKEGSEKDNNTADTYAAMASLFEKDKSITYYRKARDLYSGLTGREYEKYSCDLSIAYFLRENMSFQEANNLKEAIQFFINIGSNGRIIEGKIALGSYFYAKGEKKKSEKLHLEALEISRNINSRSGIARATDFLGRYYAETQDYKKSIKYSLESLELSANDEKIHFSGLETVASTYKQIGDYKNATLYLERYIHLKDSTKFEEQKNVINELETKYASEKKEQEIVLLTAKNALDAQKQKSQSRTLIGGIILTSLAGLFFFVLYKNRKETSEKLQELDATKSRFFENISHEFRTPLTLIKLPVSEALLSNSSLSYDELNMVHNNASRLQNLIEDLLSLSEMEVGKTYADITSQNPIKQASALSAQFNSYAESKHIRYHTNIVTNNQVADYDKKVVEKVLTNLISNAIKYTAKGGEVNVVADLNGQYLEMKVSDNGNGISEQDQDKIFDRFYQINGKDEGNQGSGIGLALVKKLLEIHQGTISVSSKKGVGSTFTATLPLANIRKQELKDKPESTEDKIAFSRKKDLVGEVKLSDKPQLLIVEDNEELRDYIKDIFTENYEVHTAQNGLVGLEKAIEFVPDFIISDWMMPEMNGIDLCQKIKTNNITSHIPFLLLTAKADVKHKIIGHETGADAYFSKPFNIEELKAQIGNLINQRKVLYEKYSAGNIPTTLSTNSHDIKFWEEFKTHLKTNLSKSELSTETIAYALAISRMQLHRKITALTGQSVGTLIRNQRMKHAVKLLADSKFRVSEICYEVGYNDSSSFTRAFKKEYGVNPTEYRKNIENK
jgi:signal transduction histidine kinase/DNA-binding response OmpR family regulator